MDHAIASNLTTAANGPASMLVVLGAIVVAAGAAAALWAGVAPSTRRRAVGTLATCAVAGVATGIVAQPGPVGAGRLCNGHVELCDRRYDDVVQAATHNSMSSPDIVRVWPEHDGNIREQLDFGIRTLMIDASYWDGIDIGQLGSLRGSPPTPERRSSTPSRPDSRRVQGSTSATASARSAPSR